MSTGKIIGRDVGLFLLILLISAFSYSAFISVLYMGLILLPITIVAEILRESKTKEQFEDTKKKVKKGAGSTVGMLGGVIFLLSGGSKILIFSTGFLFPKHSSAMILATVFTLGCGILSIYVCIKSIDNSKISGTILVILGILSTIGWFIWLGRGWRVPTTLTYTWLFIEPIIILIGGILFLTKSESDGEEIIEETEVIEEPKIMETNPDSNIFIPINSTNLSEIIPEGDDILYSTFCRIGMHNKLSNKRWEAHVIISTGGVAYKARLAKKGWSNIFLKWQEIYGTKVFKNLKYGITLFLEKGKNKPYSKKIMIGMVPILKKEFESRFDFKTRFSFFSKFVNHFWEENQ